jgi:hypothetical protein
MKTNIKLTKVRDIGELFSDAFNYLRVNFKSFFLVILVFAGPFFLINSLAGSFILKASIGNVFGYSNPMQLFSDLALPFFLIVLFSILGSAVYNTVLNEYMLIKEEMGIEEKPDLGHIRSRFFPSFWRNIGTMFLLLLFTVILYVVFALILGVFILMLKAIGVVGIMLMVLLFLFLFIVLLPVYMYIMVAVVFTGQRHKLGFFASFGKVMAYLKQNFWYTWVMSFLGGLTTYVLIILAYIPVYILSALTFFTRIKMNDLDAVNNIQNEVPVYVTVITSFVSLLIICISSIYVVMMNFHAAGLEEKATGKTIMEKIDNL